MFETLFIKLFGNKHIRDIKKIVPIVEQINQIDATLHELSENELKAKTLVFRQRITQAVKDERQQMEEAGHTPEEIEEAQFETEQQILDEILPEAYALVKEACRRLVGRSWKLVGQEVKWEMIPYDVQLIGGVVLHQGKITEMATGEGKTLVSTMPIYLNALVGRGMHVVTVNDYLAQRDSEWMGEVFKTLGLTVGCILSQMDSAIRREMYNCDITYGTNNEFGFDYLRDNMSIRREEQVQRGHYYAIVDEVDSVLIDEARTPLIIAGPVESSYNKYEELKPTVESLVKRQALFINDLLSQVEKDLEAENEYEVGRKLLLALRGAPKNKKLLKLFKEEGAKRFMQKVENEYLRDKKMHELDEELYYSIDEKSHVVDLTEKGRQTISPNEPSMFVMIDIAEEIHKIESNESFSLSEKAKAREELNQAYAERSERVHNISQLLKAYSLFEKDVEYVITDDKKVMIVDEFTGRIMYGRRYSDGLHQAIEAKEGVTVEGETQTMATITLQNYFRLYKKLAGMTGTAETEANEFWEIYKLDVTVIPTNKPVRRMDYEDVIYRTKREKYNAVVDEIEKMHKRNRPVLVGTISVEVSETLSRMLKRKGIKHNVLNAKYHKQEAEIVAGAGQPGAVTIATNMAGRGTDIKLGPGVVHCQQGCFIYRTDGAVPPPDIEVKQCMADMPCGLHIIGTERHESRRIDRQLRGRSGRQGDPGSSLFFLCLEDDLMRLFGSERIASVMDRLGAQEGDVITHGMVTRSIGRAQKRVEAQNFSIRKHLLEYDDVMNQQRTVIYDRRSFALGGGNLKQEILTVIDEYIESLVDTFTGESPYPEDWDWVGISTDLIKTFILDIQPGHLPALKPEDLKELIKTKVIDTYAQKELAFGEEMMRHLERMATLRVIDERWKEHLYEMDLLKEGIGLRAYGQKDPLLEYKQEGYRMFLELIDQINKEVLGLIFKTHVEIQPTEPSRRKSSQPMEMIHVESTGLGFQSAVTNSPEPPRKTQPIRVEKTVGRNDPCPCGSGKKYKKCHGAGEA